MVWWGGGVGGGWVREVGLKLQNNYPDAAGGHTAVFRAMGPMHGIMVLLLLHRYGYGVAWGTSQCGVRSYLSAP